MRIGIVVFAGLACLGAASGAGAQQTDFTGKWSFSGLLTSNRMVMSFAQICDLKQTEDQLAGPCHGPNGGCSLVGVVNGGNLDVTCRTSFSNNPGLVGLTTFHGALGKDEIVRGTFTSSRAPGASGVAAMMRV